jgi:hypothetical protein
MYFFMFSEGTVKLEFDESLQFCLLTVSMSTKHSFDSSGVT